MLTTYTLVRDKRGLFETLLANKGFQLSKTKEDECIVRDPSTKAEVKIRYFYDKEGHDGFFILLKSWFWKRHRDLYKIVSETASALERTRSTPK